MSTINPDLSGDYVDPLDSADDTNSPESNDIGDAVSGTDESSGDGGVVLLSTEGGDDPDDGDDSGGVGDPDPEYLDDLSTAEHDKAAAEFIRRVQSNLLNVTNADKLKDAWDRANSSSDAAQGEDLTIDGTTRLDTTVQSTSDWYQQNQREFLPPQPGSNVQLAEGNFNV